MKDDWKPPMTAHSSWVRKSATPVTAELITTDGRRIPWDGQMIPNPVKITLPDGSTLTVSMNDLTLPLNKEATRLFKTTGYLGSVHGDAIHTVTPVHYQKAVG